MPTTYVFRAGHVKKQELWRDIYLNMQFLQYYVPYLISKTQRRRQEGPVGAVVTIADLETSLTYFKMTQDGHS